MRQQFRMRFFTELHPRRAAGGEQRKRCSALQMRKQLLALLQHGQVRASGGIIHLVKAHAMQRGNDLAHAVFAFAQAHLAAERHAHSRGNLRRNFHAAVV
ncbi:hypothetical protein SDC9_162714 [bioreactor metagenome]|uniref:Uncharacterized protein n=1 Tax=bioreactor metagenome TaxID=1076179 RepID=A0A645FP70_9ZZZZ